QPEQDREGRHGGELVDDRAVHQERPEAGVGEVELPQHDAEDRERGDRDRQRDEQGGIHGDPREQRADDADAHRERHHEDRYPQRGGRRAGRPYLGGRHREARHHQNEERREELDPRELARDAREAEGVPEQARTQYYADQDLPHERRDTETAHELPDEDGEGNQQEQGHEELGGRVHWVPGSPKVAAVRHVGLPGGEEAAVRRARRA